MKTEEIAQKIYDGFYEDLFEDRCFSIETATVSDYENDVDYDVEYRLYAGEQKKYINDSYCGKHDICYETIKSPTIDIFNIKMYDVDGAEMKCDVSVKELEDKVNELLEGY